MAQNSVPLVAAQWIASVLRPGQDTTLLVARLQQFGGLRHLLGTLLFLLWSAWDCARVSLLYSNQ